MSDSKDDFLSAIREANNAIAEVTATEFQKIEKRFRINHADLELEWIHGHMIEVGAAGHGTQRAHVPAHPRVIFKAAP